MADKITTYSEQTARDILARLNRLESRQNSLLSGGLTQSFPQGVTTTRWARTCISANYPTYPAAGNVVAVELGDYEPSPLAVGSTATKTFTAFNPQIVVLATMETGSVPAQGTAVRITWREGRWWVGVDSSEADPFYIRNEHSNLTSGRGLELGELYSSGVVKADLRADCTRAYCILAEDINVNAIGRAKVSGFATARVNVLKTAHTHCYLPASETVFTTGFGGPLELCQTPTTTGAQDLLVRWQPLYRRRILTAATLLANNFGDCNFYGTTGLSTVIGNDNVYFSWMKGAVASIPYGVEGWATWDEGLSWWILDSAECD